MIGVFDSGFGGLTILKALKKHLPQYDYLYLGDTARAPYGEKSPETIIEYSTQATKFLFSKGAKIVIFACVTASSLALRDVQKNLINQTGENLRVLGVLRPIVEYAAGKKNISKIGVIGTRATVKSEAFDHEVKKINENIKVFSKACPLFVPLIEENWINKPEMRKVAKNYLREVADNNVEILILGCTHYPIIQTLIKKILPKKINIPDIGDIVAESLDGYLQRHQEFNISDSGTIKFFSSDKTNKFIEFGSKYFGAKITDVEYVNLAKYG